MSQIGVWIQGCSTLPEAFPGPFPPQADRVGGACPFFVTLKKSLQPYQSLVLLQRPSCAADVFRLAVVLIRKTYVSICTRTYVESTKQHLLIFDCASIGRTNRTTLIESSIISPPSPQHTECTRCVSAIIDHCGHLSLFSLPTILSHLYRLLLACMHLILGPLLLVPSQVPSATTACRSNSRPQK